MDKKKLKHGEGFLRVMVETEEFDPLPRFAIYTDAIIVQIFFTMVFGCLAIADMIQTTPRVPPYITYLVLPIVFFIIGWTLYFWPSKHNWQITDLLSRGQKLNMTAWSIFEIFYTWLASLLIAILVFTRVGFTYWPSLDDPATNIETDLFYAMVVSLMVINYFRLHSLWYPFWASVLYFELSTKRK